MNTERTPRHRQPAARPRDWRSLVVAFLVTLLTLPAHAGIAIPDQPLTVGARIPPNILFVLDNSGSMQWDYLPDGTNYSNFRRYSYLHNRLSYNPATTYLPWVDSTGATMTGGQNYRSVYAGTDRIPPYDNSTDDLRDQIQTFYIAKDLAGDLSNQANFWRYQIHPDEVIIRSEYIGRTGSAPNYNRGLDGYGCSTNTGTQWRNCVRMTPTGRTEADERLNYATWYSYHRTRYKIAKAASGRAFAEIGSEYRVGYRNITGNMPNSGSLGGVSWSGHPIQQAKPIPVTRNKGLFDDPSGPTGANNNKTAWYQRLYAETGSGNTPLREALYQAGEYFATDRSNNGPWGEDQFACRQNFTILTTDGYRNDSDTWSKVGEEDNVAGAAIDNPNGAPYTYTPSLPYRSAHTSTLADIAMRYWKMDLRPDLDNVVPSSTANPAFWQHMVTFSVSLGAAGTLDPETDLPAITAGTKTWPFPTNNASPSIDDLWHAAVNGRGTFVMANNADDFARALRSALSEIRGRASSFSNVASNTVSLDTGAQVFNASYVPGTWTGEVTARSVTATGVANTVTWTATLPAWNSRKVFTSTGTSGTAFPSATQLPLLARTGSTLNYPVTATDNANYIKGEDRLEEHTGGGVLRNRIGSKIGDIIGSSPAYVKETNTLYVGANDGMLHAFDAANGRELFAYVPSIININHLSTLSRGDYAHKFFVDGPVAVSNRAVTANRNILVGTLGKGGKGLYALDVTDPAAASATSVHKWERASGNNMGLILGKPFFARVQSGVAALVTANGINSTNERAVLMVLNADTGAVIREIDTGVGSTALPNGLSTPTGVYGPDGRTLAYVYAGDMLGNVWKFDLTSPTPGAWSATRLFSAVDAGGKAQPISGAVALGIHPVTKKRWVFFGTGRYLTAEDAQSTNVDVQTMYGFVDEGASLTRASLTRRAIQVTEGNVRAFEPKSALPATSKGWYIDLPVRGERIIQDAQLAARFMVTASVIPSGDACNANGTGYINALDAFTGTSGGMSYFDLDGRNGTDNTAVSGGLPVGSVNVGNGMPTLPNLLRGVLVVGGTGGSGLNSPLTSRPRWDRASWRELRRD